MIPLDCISWRVGRPKLPSLILLASLYLCVSIGVFYRQLNTKPCDVTKLVTFWEHFSQNSFRTLLEAKDLGDEFLHDIIATRKGSFIALNAVASVIIVTAVLTTRIFLGQLSVIATAQLADRMLRFMLLKVVFLGAVVSPEPADVCGYLLWAIFTAYLKAFVGLAKDRSEALLSSPTASLWQHVRCTSLLLLMLAVDAAWIVAGVRLAGTTSPFSWAFLWFFDAACVGVEGLHAGIRYFIRGIERLRASRRGNCEDDTCNTHTNRFSSEAGAESRSQFLYLLDLASDLMVHALNLIHYGHILHLRGGLRMQLIDVALLTDVRFLITAAWRRGQGHIQYRKLTHKLRYCFPDAPVEDLDREGGVTCAICMENMRRSAKVLPCGHMYHLGCLREWLQQGQGMRGFTCPMCRASLMVDDEESEEEGAEENVDYRVGTVRHHPHHHHHHQSLVRRVPVTPSTPEADRRRTRFRGQAACTTSSRRQTFRMPPTTVSTAAEWRDAVRSTRNRPTVSVYYPAADDPFFIENVDDEEESGGGDGDGDLNNNNNNNLSNYEVNEIDSWGQDIEVDWDGASCRCHNNNSNDLNNVVGMFSGGSGGGETPQTDTSGPSSSTVAFHRGFNKRLTRRRGWQSIPEAEEEEISPSSSKQTTRGGGGGGSDRRPVTRSVSRGL